MRRRAHLNMGETAKFPTATSWHRCPALLRQGRIRCFWEAGTSPMNGYLSISYPQIYHQLPCYSSS